MAEALNNFVWDQISLAHDLRVVCVDDNPEAAKFRVSFDVILDRESYQTLTGIARHRNRGLAVTLLKSIVRRGLKLFFSDEENENPIPPTSINVDLDVRRLRLAEITKASGSLPS